MLHDKTTPSWWHLGYLKVKKETFLFNRSSRSQMLFLIVLLKLSHYWSFLNKVAGLLLRNTYATCFWIFTAANTFFQLNLARIGDKCISFCPGLLWKQELNLRSSHCSFPIKKGILKIFVSFTEKHLYWSLF